MISPIPELSSLFLGCVLNHRGLCIGIGFAIDCLLCDHSEMFADTFEILSDKRFNLGESIDVAENLAIARDHPTVARSESCEVSIDSDCSVLGELHSFLLGSGFRFLSIAHIGELCRFLQYVFPTIVSL